MKVHVVFEFPEILDANSEEADNIIQCLEDDLTNFSEITGNSWYILDAISERENGSN